MSYITVNVDVDVDYDDLDEEDLINALEYKLDRYTKKDMKEREGRNPQNGQPITIKAKSVIKFKPSKTIR